MPEEGGKKLPLPGFEGSVERTDKPVDSIPLEPAKPKPSLPERSSLENLSVGSPAGYQSEAMDKADDKREKNRREVLGLPSEDEEAEEAEEE